MERQNQAALAAVVGTDGPDFTTLNSVVLGLLAQVRTARTMAEAEEWMGDAVSVALEGAEEVPGALAGVLMGIFKSFQDWEPRTISATETYQEHVLLQGVREQVLQHLAWGCGQVAGLAPSHLRGIYVPGLYRQAGGQVHVRGPWINTTDERVVLAKGYDTVANGGADTISIAPRSVLIQTGQGDCHSFAAYLGGRPNTLVAYLAHRGSKHLEHAKCLWGVYRNEEARLEALRVEAETEAHLRRLANEEDGGYSDPSPW